MPVTKAEARPWKLKAKSETFGWQGHNVSAFIKRSVSIFECSSENVCYNLTSFYK